MTRNDDWVTDLHHKESIKPKYEDGDFYWDKGKMVMTEQCHIKRGNCCGNGCKHCPYGSTYQKDDTKLKTN